MFLFCTPRERTMLSGQISDAVHTPAQQRLWADFMLHYNLVMFRGVHAVLSIVIWQHFFYVSRHWQREDIPDTMAY